MNVEITGRHINITPSIRTYVMKRLRKFTKLLGNDINSHVILEVAKDRHKAEILLKSKRMDIAVSGETQDMYSSILRAVEKLERQALKQKQRIIETKRQPPKTTAASGRSSAGGPASRRSRSNGIFEEEAHRKPMALEEAVLELGSSEYPFVVFRNVDSGDVNVLYRRKDGALGLINT